MLLLLAAAATALAPLNPEWGNRAFGQASMRPGPASPNYDELFSGLSDSSPIEPVGFDATALLNEPLEDVRVEGNTTIDTRAILHYAKSVAGRPVSQVQVKEDVRALLDTRWFFSVRPEFRAGEKGAILVFRVVERPIIRSVQFIGNKKLKTKELQAHTGLVAGHAFDVSANRESAERIKRLYREKGYRFVEVDLQKGNDQNDRDVIFQITEGPKVQVSRIRFEGNEAISSRVLKTKLSTKTMIMWLGGTYDPETIRSDVHTLTKYYHDLGYFDVVIDHNETFSEDRSKVTVTFQVEEKTRYRVRNIQVVGNEVISEESLMAEPELKTGDEFNMRYLREDVQAMKGQYDELGRIFAQVEPVPLFLEEPGLLDLVYHIDEDRPRYIGAVNIHIRGDHPHTQETVIRNQVNRYLKPGRLAKMSDIRFAQQRLRGSQLWERTDPPSIDVSPTSGKEYLPGTLIARGQDDSTFDDLFAPNPLDFAVLKPTDESKGFGHSVPSRTSAPAPAPTRTPAPVAPHRSSAPLDAPSRAPRPAAPRDNSTSSYQSNLPTPSALDVTPAPSIVDAVAPRPIIRGQSSSIYRGQSINQYGLPVPQDYLQGVSPQGDPFGDALRNPGTPGFVDVNIDVTEARTGRLMFGVGVNSDAGVVGSIVLQEDNFNILRPPTSWADVMNGQAFRGGGESLRIEAVPGSEVSRYVFSWQNPYFMNTDNSLGLSGFYYNRFFDDWTEDRLGGRISVGRIVDQFWSVGAALRLENVAIRDFRRPAPPELEEVAGDNFLSTAAVTLTYDRRDSAFIPSEGHFFEFSYEQGFGEFSYPRFEINGSQFFTIYERPDGLGKHILQFRGQAGWTGSDTPIFERFYAGGYSSFRGFAFRGVSPVNGGVRVGGEFMALGTAEYMMPITADDSIRAVVFSDFGTVEPDAGFKEFRATAGFGFRMIIPAMGPAPIALDFAWPIKSGQFDDERVFSFYVGFTR
ncbi:BamA/OMP85 family outer membrane protein [Maioricimonas rarisocia]|uniref:BamA/OMP85 family outer membrane protein n=1 Tax=Maioricimonas rarisocia TaxID=2528026 RepID=UPI0018D20CB9|nr:outer membrane protein assembly factor [Maioricimonas rarisocia]